jgi:hypothetical protein
MINVGGPTVRWTPRTPYNTGTLSSRGPSSIYEMLPAGCLEEEPRCRSATVPPVWLLLPQVVVLANNANSVGKHRWRVG